MKNKKKMEKKYKSQKAESGSCPGKGWGSANNKRTERTNERGTTRYKMSVKDTGVKQNALLCEIGSVGHRCCPCILACSFRVPYRCLRHSFGTT